MIDKHRYTSSTFNHVDGVVVLAPLTSSESYLYVGDGLTILAMYGDTKIGSVIDEVTNKLKERVMPDVEDLFERNILILPAELSVSEDLTAPPDLKVHVVLPMRAIKEEPQYIYAIRNDKDDKWWVVSGDFEYTLLIWDMDELKEKFDEGVIYGPFDEFEEAKNMAIMHMTCGVDSEA